MALVGILLFCGGLAEVIATINSRLSLLGFVLMVLGVAAMFYSVPKDPRNGRRSGQ